jgi:hypothetical protein
MPNLPYAGDLGGFPNRGIPVLVDPRTSLPCRPGQLWQANSQGILVNRTLSQVLDASLSSTQGSVIYRNASSWVALPPGAQYQVLMSGGASANPSWQTVSAIGVFYKTGLTPPLSGSFSTFNGGAATLTLADKSDRLQINYGTTATNTLAGMTQSSIATPYTIDTGFLISGGTTNFLAGLVLSDGTKYRAHYIGYASGTVQCDVQAWTNLTTVSAVNTINAGWFPGLGVYFLRITDDGTNRKYYVSADGKSFALIYTEATNTGLTPTKFGFCVENLDSASRVGVVSLYHWLVTNSVLGDAA